MYEAVRLAALTRLPASWSHDTKIANVIEIIERLRLTSATHTLVRDLRAEQVHFLSLYLSFMHPFTYTHTYKFIF